VAPASIDVKGVLLQWPLIRLQECTAGRGATPSKPRAKENTMDDLLTYSQTAKTYNFKLGTLYALVAQNRIPHVRLGRRLVRFSRVAIEVWLNEHLVQSSNKTGGVR
jgi:excisionase family DNA binding protein